MAPFKRHSKPDPISRRQRELERRLAEIREQIDHLSETETAPTPEEEHPRFRSTARPHGGSRGDADEELPLEPPPVRRLDRREAGTEPVAVNEFGVRKWDPLALFRRWKRTLRGPGPRNPKLVHYLAAGGLQGLRPLRYERRVARNRFLLVFLALLLTLWGLAWILFSDH